MSMIDDLITKYPDVEAVSVRHDLNEEDFFEQKTKQLQYAIEGGAIGVVWLSDTALVLTSRTKPHKGWALPGGRVEKDEAFDDAFLREVEEETGVKADIQSLLMVEKKVFISPTGEELPIILAVFEASGKGQEVQETADALAEGITAKSFDINALPAEMILNDKDKIRRALDSSRVA